MTQRYLLDISDQSTSINNTPNIQSQKLPFYVHSCGHFYANASYFTERKGLNNYLLIYTLLGSGHLTYNGATFNLERGSAVVFNSLLPHLYQTTSEHPWEFKYIHFNGIAMEIYDSILNENGLIVVPIDENLNLSGSISDIHNILKSGDFNKDIKICSIVNSILTQLITHKNPNNAKRHQYKNEIDGVIRYIHENYNKKIQTNDLATLMLLSKFHFIRLFKSYIGMNPYEYLINYRINLSKSLLKETTYNIGEICDFVGFNDVNNFIRYFKKLVGTTPSIYRKNWI